MVVMWKILLVSLLCICLTCMIAFSAFAADSSEVKIIVNGVTLVMADNDKVIKPIEEDGILYVPLAAFLDAMNISYTYSENTYTITKSDKQAETATAPTPAPAKTPYESLSAAEKFFLDKFLPDVKYFNDPISLRIVDVREGKKKESSHSGWQGDGGYFVLLTTTNSMGGNTQKWFAVDPKDRTFELFETDANYISEWSTALNYNIEALNNALKYKLEEMGY